MAGDETVAVHILFRDARLITIRERLSCARKTQRHLSAGHSVTLFNPRTGAQTIIPAGAVARVDIEPLVA